MRRCIQSAFLLPPMWFESGFIFLNCCDLQQQQSRNRLLNLASWPKTEEKKNIRAICNCHFLICSNFTVLVFINCHTHLIRTTTFCLFSLLICVLSCTKHLSSITWNKTVSQNKKNGWNNGEFNLYTAKWINHANLWTLVMLCFLTSFCLLLLFVTQSEKKSYYFTYKTWQLIHIFVWLFQISRCLVKVIQYRLK